MNRFQFRLGFIDKPKEEVREVLSGPYRYNSWRLRSRYAEEVAVEDSVIADGDAARYRTAYEGWRHAANDAEVARARQECGSGSGAERYALTTLSFAWGYFGLRQAIAIDSIRYAIDRSRETGALLEAESDWALVALLQAASCVWRCLRRRSVAARAQSSEQYRPRRRAGFSQPSRWQSRAASWRSCDRGHPRGPHKAAKIGFPAASV